MSEPTILIAYSTVHGHTRKVANRLAETLAHTGVAVAVTNLSGDPSLLEDTSVGAVIVAGPVRYGRHPASVRRFVRRNRDALDAMPSAFVSVSGAAGGDDPRSRKEAQGYIDRFLEKTGWSPRLTLAVGGVLAYTKYNVLLKLVIRLASRSAELPTDTSRDYEYTDWKEVDAFARKLGRLAKRESP